MVLVRRPFFRYDPVRCDRPMLYGTVSERAAKTIRFNTLWQWKGYVQYISLKYITRTLLYTGVGNFHLLKKFRLIKSMFFQRYRLR